MPFPACWSFTNRLRLDTLHAAGTGGDQAQPVPGPTPVANGSIFQSAHRLTMAINRCLKIVDHAILANADHRVAGERQRQQKLLCECSRDGKTNFGFDTVPRYLQGLLVTLVPMSKPPVVTRSTERGGQCQQYL